MSKVSRLQKVYVLMVIVSFVMQTVAPALVFAAEEVTPVTTAVVTPEPVVAPVTTEPVVVSPVVVPSVTPPVVVPSVVPPTSTPAVEVVPVTPPTVLVSSAQTIVVSDLPAPEVEFEVNSLRSHDSDLLKDFTGVVRQAKPSYCGPAALATVFGQMGKDVDQEKIADISVMDEEKGTTLYGLEQATKAFGFIPVAKKWNIETLKQYLSDTDAPVIIHDIKSNEGHFTVVREITEAGIVELSDTEAGNIAVDLKTFEHAWTNDVLIVVDRIDHPLLADESTNISDAVAKTIWGTFVLVAIGDEFSDAELRNLHYCIMKAEKKSDSKKQKEAKRACYKAAGTSIVDKSEVKILEKYGFSGLKKQEDSGNPILINSDKGDNLLNSIIDEDGNIQDIYDDIHDLEDSVKSKKSVLKKVDDKLEGMQNQLVRLDKDYKATKSSLKKASSKKQKELNKELKDLDAKISRLEIQIAAEKKRISGEIARLNKEVSQIERNITLKRSTIASKESSMRKSVAKLKGMYEGKQDTNDILTWGDKVKIAGINTIYATKDILKKAQDTGVFLKDVGVNIYVTTVDDGKVCLNNGGVQECLATCGIALEAVPAIGNLVAIGCDTVNSVVYLASGDRVKAGLSAVAIIPYIGTSISKTGKVLVRGTAITLGIKSIPDFLRAAKKIQLDDLSKGSTSVIAGDANDAKQVFDKVTDGWKTERDVDGVLTKISSDGTYKLNYREFSSSKIDHPTFKHKATIDVMEKIKGTFEKTNEIKFAS